MKLRSLEICLCFISFDVTWIAFNISSLRTCTHTHIYAATTTTTKGKKIKKSTGKMWREYVCVCARVRFLNESDTHDYTQMCACVCGMCLRWKKKTEWEASEMYSCCSPRENTTTKKIDVFSLLLFSWAFFFSFRQIETPAF